MSSYRRLFRLGGAYFFTLVTESRAPLFADADRRAFLHAAFDDARHSRPFTIDAIVLLPEHLHLLLTLPEEDADFSTRLASIKSNFTRAHLAAGGPEQPRFPSRRHDRRRGVWQRRFWEHLIRDQDDFNRHADYIHYNPVKHGLAPCPHVWPHSSFLRHVSLDHYAPDWQCTCDGRNPIPPDFSELDGLELE